MAPPSPKARFPSYTSSFALLLAPSVLEPSLSFAERRSTIRSRSLLSIAESQAPPSYTSSFALLRTPSVLRCRKPGFTCRRADDDGHALQLRFKSLPRLRQELLAETSTIEGSLAVDKKLAPTDAAEQNVEKVEERRNVDLFCREPTRRQSSSKAT